MAHVRRNAERPDCFYIALIYVFAVLGPPRRFSDWAVRRKMDAQFEASRLARAYYAAVLTLMHCLRSG